MPAMQLQRHNLVLEPAYCVMPRREVASLLGHSLAEPPGGGLRSVRNDYGVRATTVVRVAESPHESRFRVRRFKGGLGHCAVMGEGQLLYHRKTSNRPHLTRRETTTVCRMTDEKRAFGDLRAHVTGALPWNQLSTVDS